MKPFKRRVSDEVSAAATYVAAAAKITGRISGDGSYVVRGTVEGDCDIQGPVSLADGGTWRGTLRANDVVVAGTVIGDIIAVGRVEIAGTAVVNGSITGHSIAVAVGAVIEGEINVTSGQAPIKFTEKRKLAD